MPISNRTLQFLFPKFDSLFQTRPFPYFVCIHNYWERLPTLDGIQATLLKPTPIWPLPNFDMKMSFICKWMETHFHMYGFALDLALKKRLKVMRKCPIRSKCTYLTLFQPEMLKNLSTLCQTKTVWKTIQHITIPLALACIRAQWGVGGTPDLKWQGWSKDFFGFEIFDSGIFWGRKNWQVFFG